MLNADRPVPDGISTSGRQIEASRFSVYRNNVFVGLTKALAQRFPVTERLVGSDFFFAMARIYAQAHQPASPLMIEYGDTFPDFIAEFPPAAEIGYLGDVARLEAAYTQAYHAADQGVLDIEMLQEIPPEMLVNIRLLAHPSATLLCSLYPVGSIWGAHQSETVSSIPLWAGETVLVVRPEMSVNVHILPSSDTEFAQLLLRGASLGEAAEAAFAVPSTFDFGVALKGLVELGAFAGIDRRDLS